MKQTRGFFSLLGQAWKEWNEDKAERLGAALAYYTIFSIGPVLVLIIAAVGLIFGQEAAQGQIVDRIQEAVGSREAAVLIEGMIKSASGTGAGIVATVFGIVGVLLGVIGIFGQLKGALNTIWEVEPPKRSFFAAIGNNLFSFLIVGVSALLLLASIAASSLIGLVDNWIGRDLPGGAIIWQVANYAVTLLVLTGMFAMIFKFLPDVKIAWRDVWPGAMFTAFLFMVGQIGIGLYLSFSNVGSTFGAASSLVIILVWIYYSTQIIFFGAELTQVYASSRGARPEPEEGARRIAAWERAQQGLGTGQSERESRVRPKLKASPWFKET